MAADYPAMLRALSEDRYQDLCRYFTEVPVKDWPAGMAEGVRDLAGPDGLGCGEEWLHHMAHCHRRCKRWHSSPSAR